MPGWANLVRLEKQLASDLCCIKKGEPLNRKSNQEHTVNARMMAEGHDSAHVIDPPLKVRGAYVCLMKYEFSESIIRHTLTSVDPSGKAISGLNPYHRSSPGF